MTPALQYFSLHHLPSPEPSIIQITLTLFASLREAAGRDTIALDVPENARVADLWPYLVEQFPSLQGKDAALAWAVNHTYAKPDTPLNEGDQVAALPPVSGGAPLAEGDSNG